MNKLARLSLVASVALVPGYAMAMAPNTVEPPVAWEDVPSAQLGAAPQAGVTWQRRAAPPAMSGMPAALAVQAAPPAIQAPAPAAESIPQDDVQLAMAGRGGGGGRAMGGGMRGGRVGGGMQMRGGGMQMRGPAMGGGRMQMPRARTGGGLVAGGGQFQGGQSSRGHFSGGGQFKGGGQFNGGAHFNGGTHFSGGGKGGHHGSFQRVKRGAHMQRFWFDSRFRVNNWQMYGFAPPPQGWFWMRYYDDALLLDGNGVVQDYRGDMDWDRYGERWDYDDSGVPGYYGDGDRDDDRYDDRDGDYRDEVYRGAPYAPYGYAGPIIVTETTTTTYAPANRRVVEKRMVMKPHHVRRSYQDRDSAYDAPDCDERCDGPPPPPPPPPPPIPYGEKG